MACGILDLKCGLEEYAKSAIGDAITNFANAVLEAYGKTVASLGTMWVNVGTPNLTGDGSSTSAIAAGTAPTGSSEGLVTVLGYIQWIGYAIAVVALIGLGVRLMFRMGRGDGIATLGKFGWVLVGVVVLGAGTGLVSQLLPQGPTGAGGAVLFLQSSLWWWMLAFAAVSIIVGAIQLIWQQRAEPGKDLLKSLLTLIVVAGSGVTVVGILVAAADAFSVWILDGSLECNIAEDDGTCFGQNVATLLALTTNPAAGGLGSLLIIILGLIAILATAFQIVLMVARGGMLVILTGILPVAASATNTEMGRSWFKKSVAWLVAFILYKPAAAIVYAAAFQLVGTDVFQDDGTGLLSVLTGLMLMIIALFAMPALMRFVTPMVGALAGGAAGGAAGVAAAAIVPTGAAMVGRLSGGFGGGLGGGSGSSGGNGATGGGSAPSGSTGGSGSTGATTSAGAGTAPTGGTGAAASNGSAGAAAGGGAAAAGGGAAAAGAAAGPWGAVAGVALDGAKQAGQAASGAARALGEQSIGEGIADGNR